MAPENRVDDVRYAVKAVEDDDWIETVLSRVPTGVLGLVDGDDPYVVTQLFVYDADAGAVFLHGASAGRTHGIVSRTADVSACFTVSEMGRFIPATEPVDFTVEYASVDVFGTVAVLEDQAEKRAALEAFMAKYAPHLEPGEEYGPMSTASIDRTAVYRFDVESWSGKHGEKPADYPGAYEYNAVREPED